MLLNRLQTTLQKPVSFTGKGLHSGRMVKMTVKPAEVDTGIVFKRTDNSNGVGVLARADQISSTALSTTIGEGASAVSTIEHVMAAFAGLGIHNAEVSIDGPEVPIMDGSSADFVRGFMKAGLTELGAPARAYRLKRALTVVEGDKQLRMEPALRQRVKCSIEFKTKVIGAQSLEYRSSLENFLSIADARTFCHLSDVQAMREKGLALGGGLDNAIVVTEAGILNDSGLRAEDEFVRHKLLDLIGDFALLGAPLLADVYAHKSGHSMHAKAMQLLLAEKDFYLEEICPETAELADILPALSLLPQFALHYA